MIRPIQITRRGLPAHRRRSWGGTLVEAIIVVPTIMFLAFGMAEYSYFFFVKHTLEGAAREGVRNGITPSSTFASATTATSSALTAAGGTGWGSTILFQDIVNSAAPLTLTSANWAAVPAGDPIQATVTCNWGTVGVHPLGNLPGAIPSSKSVIGICVMRKEG
jgi:Flp pilus assembly protein TadG